MKRRLLIDSDVLTFLSTLRRRDRDFLLARFEAIRDFPAQHADYRHLSSGGRELDGHIAGPIAIVFWDDDADRHVKNMGACWGDDVA